MHKNASMEIISKKKKEEHGTEIWDSKNLT